MSRFSGGVVRSLRRVGLLSIGLSVLWGTGAASANEEPVVVLGVWKEGRSDPALWHRLTEHLARNGERVVPTPRLSPSEQQCLSQECLDRLATRSAAKFVLSVTAQRSGPDNLYLTGLLYDSVRHWPRQATLDCAGCKGEVLSTRVTDLADKLFLEIRTPELSLASASPAPASPSLIWGAPVTGRPELSVIDSTSYFDKISPKRKLISGVLGALSLAVFATAGAFHGLDGKPTDLSCGAGGTPQSCVWSTKWFYGSGYGLGSALLVGAALTLFWPTESVPAAAERH